MGIVVVLALLVGAGVDRVVRARCPGALARLEAWLWR